MANGLLVGGVVLYYLIVPLPMRAYGRLHLGMTLAEVERAIGSPPGIQPGTPQRPASGVGPFGVQIASFQQPEARGATYRVGAEWKWKDYWLWVFVDESGKVVKVTLLSVDYLDKNGSKLNSLEGRRVAGL